MCLKETPKGYPQGQYQIEELDQVTINAKRLHTPARLEPRSHF
jgi:hypothetical protein